MRVVIMSLLLDALPREINLGVRLLVEAVLQQ